MNPLLKRILIIVGVILAVLAIGALVLKGVCRKKWSKKHDRQSECSSRCKKCCSSESDDEDDDDDDEEDGKGSRGKMMKKHDGKNEDMPMMKKDKKD